MAVHVYILYAIAVIFVLTVLDCVRVALRPGLRRLPGPFLARFTRLYRLSLVWSGDAPKKYEALHKAMGPIVRTGPNHVSISDPAMIATIYGIGSGFTKAHL